MFRNLYFGHSARLNGTGSSLLRDTMEAECSGRFQLCLREITVDVNPGSLHLTTPEWRTYRPTYSRHLGRRERRRRRNLVSSKPRREGNCACPAQSNCPWRRQRHRCLCLRVARVECSLTLMITVPSVPSVLLMHHCTCLFVLHDDPKLCFARFSV